MASGREKGANRQEKANKGSRDYGERGYKPAVLLGVSLQPCIKTNGVGVWDELIKTGMTAC